MKSCQTCPSYVDTEEVPIVFGKAIGAPMCHRYGHVLGRPGLSESGHETLAAAFALKCDAFGEARSDKRSTAQAMVMEPDEDAINSITAPGFKADELQTCRHCSNCVRSDVVAAELGFATELCKAKGKLILRPQNEAVGCVFAQRGPQATTTDGMPLRAEYQEGYKIPSDAAASAVASIGNTQVEPTTYVSDLPVEPEEVARGIRAWRVIKQPDGPNEVPLPIFSRDFFTADEIMAIPQTGDEEYHPELYVDYDHKLYRMAVDCYLLGETIALQGPPGVGKTEFARWVAWLMQVPFHRIAFNKASEASHIAGSTGVEATATGSKTAFHLGRIASVLRRPGIVMLDEFNLAPPEVRESLRTVLDSGTLVIDEASPAIHIKKDEYCFTMVAQNPAHDVRNVGAEELAGAEYSRLSPLAVELPPEPVERHILIQRCLVDGYEIPAGVLDIVLKCSADIRVMSEQQSIPFTWGIRESIKVARKTRWYSMPTAFKAAALDFYEQPVIDQVLKCVNDHTPQ